MIIEKEIVALYDYVEDTEYLDEHEEALFVLVGLYVELEFL
jgi:hypothetical protein